MRIVLKNPLDMHLHLRDAQMLKTVAPLSFKTFSGALVMPNLTPPITSIEDVKSYKKRIKDCLNSQTFEPYMTLFFKNSFDLKFLEEAKKEILAIKLYPAGVTTNSKDGVSSMDIVSLKTTLEAMSKLGIPLCVHGETDGFVMDREKEFIPIYKTLAKAHPDLKIIMEHITTKESASLLDEYENLYATITLHHLYITLDDVAGGLFKPHLFCKPIAKTDEDRQALLDLALNAHPKVMFGSDSAPHPIDKKESSSCAAGVFTTPIALQALAQLFEKHNALGNLQKFISDNAVKIYDIKPLEKEVVLEKRDYKVPSNYGGVVAMFANEQLSWDIANVS